MEFYLNDLYPNMGFVNTRTETIPEADDRKALAENEQASIQAKNNPKEKKNIFLALALFLIITVVLGVLK